MQVKNGTKSFRSLLTKLINYVYKKQERQHRNHQHRERHDDLLYCKVQVTRDGSVYINEKPKRIHNKPLFREDNSTLTLGRDGRYYFVFTLPKERVRELPDKLVHQALAIAQKVTKMNTKRGGRK